MTSTRDAIVTEGKRSFESLLPPYRLKALPGKCQATHFYVPLFGASKGIPLRLVVCNKKTCGLLTFGRVTKANYDGYSVLWHNDDDRVFVILSSTLTVDHPTFGHAVEKLGEFGTTKAFLPAYLASLAEQTSTVFMTHDEVLHHVRVPEGGARDEATIYSRQALEAKAHSILGALFDPGEYLRFDGGTRADCCLSRGELSRVLLKQLKVSNAGDNGAYAFSSLYKDYGGMLVVFVPMGQNYVVVIPASEIAVGHVEFKNNSVKYGPYKVALTSLAAFERALYDAVIAGATAFEWPNGLSVNIGDLQLAAYSDARVPASLTQQIEQQNADKRQQQLGPDFLFGTPDMENSPADVLINDVLVQDKTACQENHNVMQVSLHKNAGRKNGKRTIQAYAVGDFDLLWVFMKDDNACIIPASVLAERGFLSSESCKGKTAIRIYPENHVGKLADPWARQFVLNMRGADTPAKIERILNDIKAKRA